MNHILAIGIPTAPQANANNSQLFDAYQRSVNFFKATVNTSADVCNDFYAYACSGYNQGGSSFGTLNNMNLQIQALQLKNMSYNAPTVLN